jgi:hypothetical protein
MEEIILVQSLFGYCKLFLSLFCFAGACNAVWWVTMKNLLEAIVLLPRFGRSSLQKLAVTNNAQNNNVKLKVQLRINNNNHKKPKEKLCFSLFVCET